MNLSTILRPLTTAAAALAASVAIRPAQAHFQMLIPSDDMVGSPGERHVRIDIKFWHPFEGHGMSMDTPVQFGVRTQGKNIDLLNKLQPHASADNSGKSRDGFQLAYDISKPGDYVFYLEPRPYWEPAEERFIVHYTKVVVNGLGLDRAGTSRSGSRPRSSPSPAPTASTPTMSFNTW